MNDENREQNVELVAGIYSGLGCLQMLLWRLHLAKHEASIGTWLEDLEKGMRWYKEQSDRGLAQGFEGRITEQSIERIARLRRLVAEWTRTGQLSSDLDRLTLQCLEELLGKDALLRLPGLPSRETSGSP